MKIPGLKRTPERGTAESRRALEARNLPLQRKPRNSAAGKKQRPGRHKTD